MSNYTACPAVLHTISDNLSSNPSSQVTTLLALFHLGTHRQENLCFDRSKAELLVSRAILRLNSSDRYPLCAVTLKARTVLVDVVSRVEKDEEELDPAIGRASIAKPDKLMSADSRVLRRMREEFGVLGFEGLGGHFLLGLDLVGIDSGRCQI